MKKTVTLSLEEWEESIKQIETLTKDLKEAQSECYTSVSINGWKYNYPSNIRINGYNIPKKALDFFKEQEIEFKKAKESHENWIKEKVDIKRQVREDEDFIEIKERLERKESGMKYILNKTRDLEIKVSNMNLFNFLNRKYKVLSELITINRNF